LRERSRYLPDPLPNVDGVVLIEPAPIGEWLVSVAKMLGYTSPNYPSNELNESKNQLKNNSLNDGRYLTIDALRGIAALSVTLFHLSTPAFIGVDSRVLEILLSVFNYGHLGVPIFFVISGFVIAATIKSKDVDFHYVGKFIVKRATRLDPPYWVAIAIEISLIYLTINLFHMPGELPSAERIVSHLFYLQNFLGLGDIAPNYWTLCIEVQFYLLLSIAFAARNVILKAGANARVTKMIFMTAFFALVGYSFLIAAEYTSNPLDGLFLPYWYLFSLGAACYWSAVAQRLSKFIFYTLCLITLLLFWLQALDNFQHASNTLVAVLTAYFLYIAALRKKLSTWLNHSALLYLGSISYTLYLLHGSIGDRFISFFHEWLLPHMGLQIASPIFSIALLIAAIGVSILACHIVFLLIEKPAMRLSKRIKPNSKTGIFNDIRNNQSAQLHSNLVQPINHAQS